MRKVRGMLRAVVSGRAALPVAVLAALAAAAPAGSAGLDAISAHVQAALADPATTPKARARLDAVSRRLARPDVPGLADEFAKAEFAARQVRGPLAGDSALAAAAESAVDSILGALDAEEAGVRVAALDVETVRSARSVQAKMSRGRSRETRARTQRVQGRIADACASGRLAATDYRGAAVLVERALAKQAAKPGAWKVVLDGLGGALLSVHATALPAAPVFVAGADDGAGPTFLRGGREGFARIDVGGAGDLWWVDSVPGGGVWTCGSGGIVATYDPETGAVAQRPVAAQSGILYGVWGSGPGDVWVVGEDPDADGPVPAAFRWDGAAWSPAALPEAVAGLTLYKVWGTGASDVWACGRAGVILHFDGTAWSEVASGTPSSLLTLHGDAPAVAVGLAPVIVERGAGGAWSAVPLPPGTESLNGCRVGADGDAWAVGYFRTVLRRTTRGWARVTGLPATEGRDFHSVTIDAQGGVWIAGGTLTSRTAGALLHFGNGTFSSAVLPAASLGGRVGDVFRTSCAQAACHSPPFLSEGLDLDTADGLRARVADVPSRQSPFPLVVPGRPSASYLFRKLDGTHIAAGGSGTQMPQGETLAPGDADAVRAWILEGAPTR